MALSEFAAWGSLALSLVLLALFLWQTSRVGNLERRYKALIGGSSAGAGTEPTLADLVTGQTRRLDKASKDLIGLSNVVSTMENSVQCSVQHVGLIRFNPFQETGGDQSFALALLDGRGDGIVISSLHSRAVTRFYAKPIKGGAPQMSLSTEETQALQRAMEK
ncbi:MAG: DUF4446 family protein [Chloroflexia bacterium]